MVNGKMFTGPDQPGCTSRSDIAGYPGWFQFISSRFSNTRKSCINFNFSLKRILSSSTRMGVFYRDDPRKQNLGM